MNGSARTLRLGDPIWLHGWPHTKVQRYPTLTGHHHVDVVIVGGGMTGALVALTFAEAGASVLLAEAALVGRGSTVASSALLLEEPDLGLAELAARYGRADAVRIWQLSRDAVRNLTKTLRGHRVSCDLVHRDTVYYAVGADQARRLRRERKLRTAAGFRSEWLTPGPLRKLTGIAAHGAIRTTGSAQFNPHKACRGIMEAAASTGAVVCERSPVVQISRSGQGVQIRTERGRVDAARVVIATGYATPHFRPLAGSFRMYRTYALATRPLTERQRHEIGLADIMVWDTQRPYHYARWTPDHRLLIGGGDRRVRPGARRDLTFIRSTRELRDDFEALLPALADLRFEAAWEGLFAMTPDSLPYIGPHRRYPDHLFALGYGGNGMTFSYLAARMLLEQWQGIRSPDHRLFGFGR